MVDTKIEQVREVAKTRLKIWPLLYLKAVIKMSFHILIGIASFFIDLISECLIEPLLISSSLTPYELRLLLHPLEERKSTKEFLTKNQDT